MEKSLLSCGSAIIDSLLGGGFEKNIITTVYGPSGSGKTNICVLAAATTVIRGKKVIYIDTEGGFCVDRMQQISPDYKTILASCIFFSPTTFAEQKEVFEKLHLTINDDIGLIIVDTISMLYRLELGKSDDIPSVNRELGGQLSVLAEITRKKNIPVLITNQVYANFDDKNRLNMVGGDILKYSSKCLVELCRNDDRRSAVLRKHRSMPDGAEVLFRIINDGIIEDTRTVVKPSAVRFYDNREL
ncbi:DNA repair and recombination protein RadB [Candidatus Woesearchaeota archaeon]|nr:DNA repair and recombination protein RadB [Candidatus Woesearchaeota archaeon]